MASIQCVAQKEYMPVSEDEASILQAFFLFQNQIL
jgi:hypothetical protein